MEAAVATQSQPQHSEGPSQRGRSGRGGRGRGRGRGLSAAALQFRPASVAPVAQTAPAASHHENDAQSAQTESSRGRRGRNRRGPARNAEPQTVNGRAFGGRLTRDETKDEASKSQASAQLHGSAATFIPGQQNANQNQQSTSKSERAKNARPPKQRPEKSSAADIATRTHEDIDNGYYECAICTNEVRRNSKVWSCHTCWTVFHIHCVKAWSASSIKQQEERVRQGADEQPQWRCPGCNLPKDTLPKSYTCWCEKEYDPKPLAGIPPHSCGQSCGKERPKKCPHPCQVTCHAGPCPPCTHMGPTQSCFCGKHESTKRCTETEYTSGWSCGEVCGQAMACGEHFCTRPCHEGPCGTCDVRLPARCYCGKMEKDVLCGDRGISKDSQQNHQLDSGEVVLEKWTGSFDCENRCERHFDCGIHTCQQTCHPQTPNLSLCPRSPVIVTHCTCGKTPLSFLTNQPRLTCEDPIPSCDQPCNKTLSCGHLCPKVCHSGDCGACMETITITCRCGRNESSSICHQGSLSQPQCRRICRVNLNCGRHACEERCCPGERKAVERLATKRKGRPLNSAPRQIDDSFEAEHICTRQCGRPLKCGNHFCEELCHKGPCLSCREAIFEEISCHCGRTVLMPPLPCGTQPPPCRHPCQHSKSCGHPQVPHNCHQDSETCPKCPFLVERRCMCGKKSVKNQPCWLNDVRCGEICGKKLKCGYHVCRKLCHRNGECEDAHGQVCQQPCGKEKKICGHPDEEKCHSPYPCKEEKPCTSKIFITCECQAQKQEMKCGASKHSEGNSTKTLPCNEECARLERNRKLALALNIDQSTHITGADHNPFSTETLSLFASQSKWATQQEREFRVFASSEDEKRLRFKPMQPSQRAFIHALAADFGLDSESVDPEPHRHVLVWKTPRFVSAPNKTLADALRLRQSQSQPFRSINTSDTESGPTTKPTKLDPLYNSFVIRNPRFALTLEEVRTELNTALPGPNPFSFSIDFLPSEAVILKAVAPTLSDSELERMLQNIRVPLTRAISSKGLGGNIQLCSTDSSLNITRLESDALFNGGIGSDGWSRVAAKKALPRMQLRGAEGVGGTNSFAALSGGSGASGIMGAGKVTFAKKKAAGSSSAATALQEKQKKEVVVDDWEAEMAEEERGQENVTDGDNATNAGPAEVGAEPPTGAEDAVAGSSSTSVPNVPEAASAEIADIAEPAQEPKVEQEPMVSQEPKVEQESKVEQEPKVDQSQLASADPTV